MEQETYTFPDGRQIVRLAGSQSYRLQSLDGVPMGYLVAEHVDYAPTMPEQRLLTR